MYDIIKINQRINIGNNISHITMDIKTEVTKLQIKSINCKRFWNSGYCKYGNRCRNLHSLEIASIGKFVNAGRRKILGFPCMYFNSPKGCHYNSGCLFKHQTLTEYRNKLQLLIINEEEAAKMQKEKELAEEQRIREDKKRREEERIAREQKIEEERIAREQKIEEERLQQIRENEDWQYRKSLFTYQQMCDNNFGVKWQITYPYLDNNLKNILPDSIIRMIADYGCADNSTFQKPAIFAPLPGGNDLWYCSDRGNIDICNGCKRKYYSKIYYLAISTCVPTNQKATGCIMAKTYCTSCIGCIVGDAMNGYRINVNWDYPTFQLNNNTMVPTNTPAYLLSLGLNSRWRLVLQHDTIKHLDTLSHINTRFKFPIKKDGSIDWKSEAPL